MGKYYSTTLQKGSNGADVTEWQKFLRSQGYANIEADGIFGKQTVFATEDWKKRNGFAADSLVDDSVWQKAGYSNINTPTAAPNINTTGTPLPTTNTTTWDDTEKGSAALDNKNNAYTSVYGTYNPETGKYEGGYGPFTFSLADWAADIDKKIKGYSEFSYDLNGDALYQQYKDKYIQQGKLAMQDTMGQAAAMTGGYGNSYAQSVGQQAYQASLDNLNDIVPELYSLALDRYKMGKDDLYSQASYLMQKYEQEYGAYSDEYKRLLDALGIANDDYYKGADMYYTEQDNKNTELWNQWEANESIRTDSNDELWKQAEWNEGIRQNELSSGKYGSTSSVNNNNNNIKQQPEKETEPVETAADYADWSALDWEGYFAEIRNGEGGSKAEAEEELNRMIEAGLIPQNMIYYASIGARGHSGH